MTVLFPVVPIAEWAKRHKLELEPVVCRRCANQREFTRPITIKTDVGLAFGIEVGDPCEFCGNGGKPIRLAKVEGLGRLQA